MSEQTMQVWSAFVAMLHAGQVSSIPICPYHPDLRGSLQAFLQNLPGKTGKDEWHEPPDVHRVENQVHFLLDLTLDQQRDTYCFSFLLQEEQWFFQHVECITLRLDQLGPLPSNQFPDLPEAKKAWMREEIRVSEMIRLFGWLAQEKGRAFALDWFLDGAGYALAARAWVPFVPAQEAFILYLGWEQTHLHGSTVTLIELNEQNARLEIDSLYLQLYRRSAHLRQQISFEDYLDLFEHVWTERAKQAGWQVAFAYRDETCAMAFRRT